MRRLLLVLCLLLLPPAAWAEAPGKGRLWRIERPGLAPSYLFGTMHSSAPDALALPGSVLRAFAGSTVVVGELDMAKVNYGAIMASALLPAGQSLADHLSPELYERTLAAVAPLGLAPAVADRLEIWFLGLMLSNDPAEIERQRQGKSVLDDWLQQEGRRQGKTIVGLETLGEQLAIFAGWPEPLQVAMLRAALDFPGLIAGSNAALTALWLDGDLPSMWRLFRVSLMASGPEFRRRMTQELVIGRNHSMAERLAPILTLGGVFVAVGALHLAGDEGLIVLLRDQGWTVTRAD
jgi:uncharacterized protein YbaP (TraB family)